MDNNVYIGSPKGKNFNSILILDGERSLVRRLFGPCGFAILNGMRGSDLYFELNQKAVSLGACIDNDTWLGEQIGTLTSVLGKLRTLRNLCHNYPTRKFRVV